jgi:APA family basic amino acid/polyamine antiporter
MGEEEKLLFVRESSGLVKEVGTGFAILLPIALTLGPWYQFAAPIISSLYPGAFLSVMFIIGTITIFFEAISDTCLMLAMPRSGAAYYFTGRGLSPLFGVMEGWRSVITNPFFRGTGAFQAIEVLNGGILVMGLATGDTFVQGIASALTDPLIKVIVSLVSVFIGFIFGYLSVKWLGWFVIIIGILVIAATVISDIILLAIPIDSTLWDATFGGTAGLSYTELSATYPANDLYTTLNLGAVGSALVFTVGMMWPYLIMPIAGEVAQPSKNIPLSNMAGALGIGAIAILGAVSLESSLGTFLYSAGQGSIWGGALYNAGFNAGFGNFAAIALQGNPVCWFLVMGPLLSSIADSPSNALWVTRPFHAMAMDRFCPEIFASVHPKYHVPHISLYFWLILTIISVILTAWFQLGVLLGVAFTYVFIRWQMMLAAVALPYHRPTLWERSGAWAFIGIPLISIGGLIAGAVFFAGMITFAPSATYEVPFTVGVYLIGQLAYMYYGSKNKAKGIEMGAIFGQLPPE